MEETAKRAKSRMREFQSYTRTTILFFALLAIAVVAINFGFNEEFSTYQCRSKDASAEETTLSSSHSTASTKAPPRVLLLSAGIGEDYLKEKYPRVRMNRFCYGAMHNYTSIVDMSDYLKGQNKRPDWIKPASITKWLPYYDWILYTDPDILIFNFSQSLQPWMDMDGYDFFFPQEHAGARVFSLFTILIRNTPFARQFINEWYADRFTGCDMHGDQVPLHMLLLDYMAKLSGEENYKQPCRALCNDQNYNCFSNEAARFGWGGNPATNKPPFFFTPYNLGEQTMPVWGLQGKWGEGSDLGLLRTRPVFLVHHNVNDAWTKLYDEKYTTKEGEPKHCTETDGVNLLVV